MGDSAISLQGQLQAVYTSAVTWDLVLRPGKKEQGAKCTSEATRSQEY